MAEPAIVVDVVAQDDDEAKLRTEAAITIQAYWRGFSVRRKVKQRKNTGEKVIKPA